MPGRLSRRPDWGNAGGADVAAGIERGDGEGARIVGGAGEG